MTPTVSMDVSYLRPGPTEGPVCIRARIVKPGKSLVNAAGELWVEGREERPLAAATGIYCVMGEGSEGK